MSSDRPTRRELKRERRRLRRERKKLDKQWEKGREERFARPYMDAVHRDRMENIDALRAVEKELPHEQR